MANTMALEIQCGDKCVALVDSLDGYGQLSQGGVRHVMYSAATAHSTMDFSMMDVVDSPPTGGNRPKLVHSPSPLKSHPQSPRDHSGLNSKTQRKLYDEEMDVVAIVEVEGAMPMSGAIGKKTVKDIRTAKCREHPSISEGILLPQTHLSSLGDAKWQCKTHDGLPLFPCSCRLWDAWEQRSLKKQW